MPYGPQSGMLGQLFNQDFGAVRQEDLDQEKQLQQLSAMDGFQADRYATYGGAQMAGKGIGSVAAVAAGKDPRTPAEQNASAVQAAKAEASQLGFNPDDPDSIDDFYKKVIQILQQKGLIAEAMAVAKEWSAEKSARAKEALAQKESGLKVGELERKKLKDERANQLGVLRIASAEQIAAARSASAKDIADAKLDYAAKQTGPFKSVDYNDHVEIINRFGEVVSSKPKGLTPKDEGKAEDKANAAETAYATVMQTWQSNYNAAVKLYNHPGLDDLVGRFSGIAGEPTAPGNQTAIATRSGPGREALALFKQVQGGTFLAGLAELKAASKTGASGLGAVSEIEGAKVQDAKAALYPRQDPPAFRRQLATYIQGIEQSVGIISAAAQRDGLQPRTLQTVPLTGPARGGHSGRSVPAPAPVAPTAPAPTAPKTIPKWSPEKENRYQELLKKQNGSA